MRGRIARRRRPQSRSTVFYGPALQLSMPHWFDSFHISPVFSNSVNINYCSDVQIAIRPYDDAFVHPVVHWQLDCAAHTVGDSTRHGDALRGCLIHCYSYTCYHGCHGTILKENIAGTPPPTFMKVKMAFVAWPSTCDIWAAGMLHGPGDAAQTKQTRLT